MTNLETRDGRRIRLNTPEEAEIVATAYGSSHDKKDRIFYTGTTGCQG